MRVTAICPCCKEHIATRFTLSKRRKDLRRCDHCGALVFRVNTDIQPWSLLILITALGPFVLMPVAALWFAAELGWWSIVVGLSGLLWAAVFDYLQTPYTNGYVQWYPTCRDCGYDMRGSTGLCPECGATATRHPEADAVPAAKPAE